MRGTDAVIRAAFDWLNREETQTRVKGGTPPFQYAESARSGTKLGVVLATLARMAMAVKVVSGYRKGTTFLHRHPVLGIPSVLSYLYIRLSFSFHCIDLYYEQIFAHLFIYGGYGFPLPD
ncbi:unnamed protein product, partial [Cuscuta europaea]